MLLGVQRERGVWDWDLHQGHMGRVLEDERLKGKTRNKSKSNTKSRVKGKYAVLRCISWNQSGNRNHTTVWQGECAIKGYWPRIAAKSLQSCPTLCDPIDGSPPGSRPWDSPGKNTGVGYHLTFLQLTFSNAYNGNSTKTLNCPLNLYYIYVYILLFDRVVISDINTFSSSKTRLTHTQQHQPNAELAQTFEF